MRRAGAIFATIAGIGVAACLAAACTGLSGLSGGDDEASADASLLAEASLRDGGQRQSPDGAACSANLQTDKKNCGRCGRDCLGADCTGGKCAPIVLAPALQSPNALLLSGDRLYFTTADDGTVQSVPKAGGAAPTIHVQGEPLVRGVALAGGTLFWASAATAYDDAGTARGGIWSCELPACATRTNVVAIDLATSPIIRDDVLYFGGGIHGEIWQTSPTGGALLLISIGSNDILAVDPPYLYHAAGGTLLRVVADGGGVASDETVQGGERGAGYIAFDSARIYWEFVDDNLKGHVVGFSKASPGAGAIEFGNPADNLNPIGVAVDDVNVYWSTAGPDLGSQSVSAGEGKVFYCPKSGCPAGGATVLVSDNLQSGQMAIDDEAIYWLEYGSASAATGRLRKIAKP